MSGGELDWTVPVTISDLPPDGAEFELVPDHAARVSLAERAGVLAVPRLVAQLKVRPSGRSGAAVEGTLEATVRQTCVVSLEPFDNEVRDSISLRFEPPDGSARQMPQTEEIVGEDPPEPLIEGKLDLAPVVAEFLVLAVDPYPRKPGTVFAPPADADERREQAPFAELAKLKRPGEGEKQ